LAAWQASQARYGRDSLGSDPDWCRGIEAVYPDSLRWVRLGHGVETVLVPWLLRRREMDCRLGEWAWCRFHPRLVQPAGDVQSIPADPDLYATLFSVLQKQGDTWDVMHLDIPTASPLWNWLQAGQAENFGLRVYRPGPPTPHFLLEFPASFTAYAAKFTAKTRKNREREVRHLEQHGRLELRCYRAMQEVDAFLDEAGAVSQQTYQHKLLKTGLREAARLRPRLQVAAAKGWLRSYVLSCGGEACAYMLGYQYRGRYYYTTIGYHPRWAPLSAGTVLHWLVLQDMFAHEPPRIFDFGTCGAQKRYFSNCEYEEVSVYLFRRGIYPWLVRTGHGSSLRASRSVVHWLARHKLKPAAQRCVRRFRGC
jgi:CelD/BcsL family acetyltransferase involved in cellulose biosynthesis